MKVGMHLDRAMPLAAAAIGALLSACSPDDVVGGTGGASSSTGGATASGGVSGGSGGSTLGTGGTSSGTGGASIGSGGLPGTGGMPASGGVTVGSGGVTVGTGGASGGKGSGGTTGGSGGRISTGGVSGTGGALGSGGGGGVAGTGAGGMAAAGGMTGAAGATSSSGCGKAPPMSNTYTIDVGGTQREYILAVPTNYNMSQPYPVVFAWHPAGGSAQQTAGSGNSGYLGLRGASNGAAILVSPDGLAGSSGSKGWANTGDRDIAFLKGMIERLKAELCIDERRIFSTGFSYGGSFSYAVGCSGLARAIAPMSGGLISGCASGTQTAAMMGFHGDADTVAPTASGRRARDTFVMRNKCTEQTMPPQPNYCDGVSSSNQPCTCVSYQGCTAGYPVIWCEFTGGHTFAPNSAAAMWSFFSQF